MEIVLDVNLVEQARKLQFSLAIKDRKPRLGRTVKKCFTGEEAALWLISSGICSVMPDALQLLTLMQRQGLIHHVKLETIVMTNPGIFMRFPEDEFQMLVDKARLKKKSRYGTASGSEALSDLWYINMPALAPDAIYNARNLLMNRIQASKHRLGLRQYMKSATGSQIVSAIVQQGLASAEQAVGFGNALLKAGAIHHVHLSKPFLDSQDLYRFPEHEFEIMVANYRQFHDHTFSFNPPPVESEDSRMKDALEKEKVASELPVELASSSRYWTSYRASRLYTLTVTVVEGYIDMNAGFDSHLDEMFATYCSLYLTRDPEGTHHTTSTSTKTLNPVWNYPISLMDVDYLDRVVIDLMAKRTYSQDIMLGQVCFEAHEVMDAGSKPLVVEFNCGGKFCEGAAAILTVTFDPLVAVSLAKPEEQVHHQLLCQEAIESLMADAPRQQLKPEKGSHRISIAQRFRGGDILDQSKRRSDIDISRSGRDSDRGSRRSVFTHNTASTRQAPALPAYISVQGGAACVLLDELGMVHESTLEDYAEDISVRGSMISEGWDKQSVQRYSLDSSGTSSCSLEGTGTGTGTRPQRRRSSRISVGSNLEAVEEELKDELSLETAVSPTHGSTVTGTATFQTETFNLRKPKASPNRLYDSLEGGHGALWDVGRDSALASVRQQAGVEEEKGDGSELKCKVVSTGVQNSQQVTMYDTLPESKGGRSGGEEKWQRVCSPRNAESTAAAGVPGLAQVGAGFSSPPSH